MKLYYAPGVCSLAPHITLAKAGYDYEVIKVDLRSKKTESGDDYLKISATGMVPYLVLDNGEGLSEVPVIMQYLADQKPEAKLVPENGTFERVRLQEWLNYISTEVHKAHWPIFFADQAGEQAKTVYIEKVKKAYSYVSKALEGREFLYGDSFTIADAYLFNVLQWHIPIKLDQSPWPVLVEYQKRIAARPAVQKAMEAEGLLKKAAA